MRAEIISISNGAIQGNKITMVRGDTLEITLRVLDDNDIPIPLNLWEEETHTIPRSREPHDDFVYRLSAEFLAELKDGGDIRLIYRTTQSTLHVRYGNTDEMTIVIDQYATKRLPAPLTLNFDMQVTDFGEKAVRTSTVYKGTLQIEKDFTTQY